MSNQSNYELDLTRAERNQKVYRSVNLIQNSRYSLTLQEQRFLMYCISKVRPDDTVETVYDIQLKDYVNVSGLRGTTNYTALKQQIIKTLDKLRFLMEETDEEGNKFFMVYNWFSKMGAGTKGTGFIRFQFTQDVAKELINLAQYNADSSQKLYYIADELKYMLPFKCRYSYYLYPLLRSYQNRNEWTFQLDGPDGLRERLDVFARPEDVQEYNRTLEDLRDAYNQKKSADETGRIPLHVRYPEFRRNVLDPAVADINKYSNIKVAYRANKVGKAVTSITFIFEDKQPEEAMDAERRGQLVMDRTDETTRILNEGVPRDLEEPVPFAKAAGVGDDTHPKSKRAAKKEKPEVSVKQVRKRIEQRQQQWLENKDKPVDYGKHSAREKKPVDTYPVDRYFVLKTVTVTADGQPMSFELLRLTPEQLGEFCKEAGGGFARLAERPGFGTMMFYKLLREAFAQLAPKRLRGYLKDGHVTCVADETVLELTSGGKTPTDDLRKFFRVNLSLPEKMEPVLEGFLKEN